MARLVVLLILAAILGGLHTSAHAARNRLDAESLLDWEFVSDPRWSPDGSQLVYTETRAVAEDDRYASTLRLLDANGRSRRLTAPGSNASMPRWSPDGATIAFLSNRDGRAQVYALALRGGEARALSDVDGHVRRFAWSPDGEQLALLVAPESAPKKGPFVTESLRVRRDARRGYSTGVEPRLALVGVSTAKPAPPRWLSDGKTPVGAPSWSANGESLYYSAQLPDAELAGETEVFRIDIATGSATAVTDRRGPDQAYPSPDGRWLAVVGFDRAERPASYQTTELTLIDLTGELGDRKLTTDYAFAVGDAMAGDVNAPGAVGQRVVWAADSASILYTSAQEGRVQLLRTKIADGVTEAITRLDTGELREFDVSAGGIVAAVYSRPDLAPNLVSFNIYQGSRGAWRQLTNVNAAMLEKLDLAAYEEIRLPAEPAAAEGDIPSPALQAWLISPPKLDRRRRYPLVLYIHGGPHAMYGSNFFHEFQVLAAAGYHVLIANPRGSTGYGDAFGNSIQYNYPGDDANDLLRVLDHVLATVETVDADRLGVAGGSGGGLLTTWLIGQTDRFKAASAHRSVTNWYSFVGTADLNKYFLQHWFEAPPWGNAEAYLERSPLRYVGNVSTPIQLIHSDADYRTPLEQSLQYYTALRALGKTAELVVFKDESHGLSRGGRPSNRVARLRAIKDWFDRYLQPGPARR